MQLRIFIFIHVGQCSDSLIELTPTLIKSVFKDNSFDFSRHSQCDNNAFFFNGTGKPSYWDIRTSSLTLNSFLKDNH
jgi:hypothetical protein